MTIDMSTLRYPYTDERDGTMEITGWQRDGFWKREDPTSLLATSTVHVLSTKRSQGETLPVVPLRTQRLHVVPGSHDSWNSVLFSVVGRARDCRDALLH